MLYWSLFGCGILLSMHCVGMCGGFVALLSASTGGGHQRHARAGAAAGPAMCAPPKAPLLRVHLLYHFGRIASYSALGALAGGLGSLTAVFIRTGKPQAWLMLGAGGFMAAAGLAILGLTRWNPMRTVPFGQGGAWGRVFRAGLRRVLSWPRAAVAAPYGAMMGLLPCGLIYTMLIRAAATTSAWSGAAVMASFGAGTIPALLMVAYGARFFTVRLRQRLFAFSGVLLFALGIAAMFHGAQWVHWAA